MYNKVTKVFLHAVCFLLAMVMLLDTNLHLLALTVEASEAAEASGGLSSNVEYTEYVDDVRIGTKESLEKAGYVVVGNMNNERNDKYIGYKATSDASNGITDLSIMDMYGGATKLSYLESILEEKEGYNEYIKLVTNAITEFRTKYKEGSDFAILAYEILNYLVRPKDDENFNKSNDVNTKIRNEDIKVGDFLLKEALTKNDYLDLTMITSSVISSYIYNQLALAVADEISSETWVERLCNNGPLVFTDKYGNEITDEGELNQIYLSNYDGEYLTRAKRIFSSIKTFSTKFVAAKEFHESNPSYEFNHSEEEYNQAVARATSQVKLTIYDEEVGDEKTQAIIDENEMILYVAMYLTLSEKVDGEYVYQYGYNEDGSARSLAEFILDVGTTKEEDEDYISVLRSLYPFMVKQNGVTPLTLGQESMLYINGFLSALSYGTTNEYKLEEMKQDYKESCDELLEANDGELVSLWFNTNREFFYNDSDGIYWTSEMAKKVNTQAKYDDLTRNEPALELTKSQKLKNALIGCGIAGLVFVAALYISLKVVVSLLALEGNAAMFVALKSAFTVFTSLSTMSTSVAAASITTVTIVILIVVMVIVIIAMLFSWKAQEKREEEAALYVELTEMPKVIYDYNDHTRDDAVSVRYDYVKGVDDNGPVNLLEGRKNQPWNVMYYTKDRSVGEPITIQHLADGTVVYPFMFTDNTNVDTNEYYGVHFFDTVSVVDLNSRYRASNAVSMYLYMHRPTLQRNKGSQSGKYITSVKLFGYKDQLQAKTEIQQRGYVLLDNDLGEESSGVHIYIGYTTTDVASYALTDLRAAYYTGQDADGASIRYGSSTYGCCGCCNELQLFQTTSSAAGTPILANSLAVTTSIKNIPKGFEPIISFTGGPAFDFYEGGDWSIGVSTKDSGTAFSQSDSWVQTSTYTYNFTFNSKYVYFEPETKFTEGEDYISGICAIYGEWVEKYISDTGWIPFLKNTTYVGRGTYATNNLNNRMNKQNPDLAAEGKKNTAMEEMGVFCYSTTKNPYRAIYDIRFYQCEVSSDIAAYNLYMGTPSLGYTAIDTHIQHCWINGTRSGTSGAGAARTFSYTHCYKAPKLLPDGKATYELSEYTCVDGDLWVGSVRRACTLYLAGCNTSDISKAEPIKVSELRLSKSGKYDPTVSTPVRDIRNWFSEEAACLTSQAYSIDPFYTRELNNKVYKYFVEYPLEAPLYELYFFIDRPDTVSKGKYVASITVGYSGEGTTSKYDDCVYQMVRSGAGEMIEIDIASNSDLENELENINTEYYRNKIFTDSSKNPLNGKTIKARVREYDYPVAYIWVTYTKTQNNAITNIYIDQLDAYDNDIGDAPSTTTAYTGAKVDLAGSGFMTKDDYDKKYNYKYGDGERPNYYYIYTAKQNANPVLGFDISENVMELGKLTVQSLEGKASGYDTFYFHTTNYYKTTFTYYVKDMVCGTGNSEKEAQVDLLNQGCQSCIMMDLSSDPSKSTYLGVVRETSKTNPTTKEINAISGIILKKEYNNENVKTIYWYKDEYFLLGANINSEIENMNVQIYGTSSERKAHELKPTVKSYSGHYISDVMFWKDKDLYSVLSSKDPVSSIKSYIENGDFTLSEKEYLSYYLLNTTSSKTKAYCWDIVTDTDNKICNINWNNSNGSEMYMYVRYTDGYMRDTSTLAGSLFLTTEKTILITSSVAAVCLISLGIIVILKKKKQAKKSKV